MPKVGNKTFAYDSKGYKDAEQHSKNTGVPMTMKKGGKIALKKGGKAKGYSKGGKTKK
tara:strand:+ start:1770 stop:1943 length:174 start_codon:yes stop_codon:yes gene_type:complete